MTAPPTRATAQAPRRQALCRRGLARWLLPAPRLGLLAWFGLLGLAGVAPAMAQPPGAAALHSIDGLAPVPAGAAAMAAAVAALPARASLVVAGPATNSLDITAPAAANLAVNNPELADPTDAAVSAGDLWSSLATAAAQPEPGAGPARGTVPAPSKGEPAAAPKPPVWAMLLGAVLVLLGWQRARC